MIKSPDQSKDQYPSYCLSFSPNWNTYQILSTNSNGLLVYGTNAEAFIIDMQNKNFISSVKPPEEASYNQIKVTSVLLEEDTLFVGYLNGIICAFNHQKENQLLFKTQVSKSPIMHIIKRTNTQGTARLLLVDSEGAFFELVYIQETAKVFSLSINCFSQVVKCHEFFSPSLQKSLLLTISAKGIITIWDLEAKKEIFNYNTTNAIFKADFIFDDEFTITCGLITKKDFLVIVRIHLKTIFEESPQFQAYPVKLHFQIQSKDKNDSEVLASKPDIMFLSKDRLLMSGKTGELFIITTKSLETKQELKLRHLSAMTEEEETSYQIVERNPHYKQIYGMGKYVQKNNDTTVLYTLGIDRKLSFWKYEDEDEIAEVTPMWNINYLGGKVRKIVTSEIEKNKIFFSCIDKTLRVWDLEKKNNKFSTQEIWKQVSHTQIFNLSMHPSFEGLSAYSTEDSKICNFPIFFLNNPLKGMYDISSQVCFKVLKVEREIRSLQWIHKDLYKNFVTFAEVKDANFPNITINKTTTSVEEEKEEGEEAKVNIKYGFLKTSDAKFTKNVPEDYMLLVTLKDNYLMLMGMTEKIEFYNTELLVNQDSFSFIPLTSTSDIETELLIATGSKDGKCTFYKVSKTKVDQLCSYKFNNYHISTIKFNRISPETVLCATGSHDRKIMVYEISLNFGGNHVETKITPTLMFKHKNKVDNLKWSIKSNLLAISTQDRTVQVWNCLITEEDRKNIKELTEPTPNREICNIRGHDGFITDATFSLYDEDIVITASDDQTIKVWDIKKILHKTLANPKKKNKQKKNKQKHHQAASLEDQEPDVEKKIKSERVSSGDHNIFDHKNSPKEQGLGGKDDEEN